MQEGTGIGPVERVPVPSARSVLVPACILVILLLLAPSVRADSTTTWNTTGAFDSGNKGEVLYVGQTGKWSYMAPLAHAVADLSSVTYQGRIYVFGGYASGAADPTNYTQIYNAATNTWSQGTTLPTKRWGAASADLSGVVYVFGGDINATGTGTDKNEAYSIAGDSWSTKAAVPSALAHQGIMAATVGAGIYVFYGTNAQVYYPGNNSWFARASSSKSRTWSSVSVVGTDIYLIGGYTGAAASNDVRVYHTATNTWNDAYDTAPYTAWGMVREAPTNGSVIYEAMGFSGSSFFARMYAYYYATKTWIRYTDAPHALDGPASGFVNGELYVIGGRDWSLTPVGTAFNQRVSFVTPNDGNYQVETVTDNPNTPIDSFKLRGYGGDAYSITYANGSNAKWVSAQSAASDLTRCSMQNEIAGFAQYTNISTVGNQNCQTNFLLSKSFNTTFDLRVHAAILAASSGTVNIFILNTTSTTAAGRSGIFINQNAVSGLTATYTLNAGSQSACGSTYNPGLSTWFRVSRTGNTWTVYTSPDGSSWTTRSTCTQASNGNLYYQHYGQLQTSGNPFSVAWTRFQMSTHWLSTNYSKSGAWISPAVMLVGEKLRTVSLVYGSVSATANISEIDVLDPSGATVASMTTPIESGSSHTWTIPNGTVVTGAIRIRVLLVGDGGSSPVVSSVSISAITIPPASVSIGLSDLLVFIAFLVFIIAFLCIGMIAEISVFVVFSGILTVLFALWFLTATNSVTLAVVIGAIGAFLMVLGGLLAAQGTGTD